MEKIPFIIDEAGHVYVSAGAIDKVEFRRLQSSVNDALKIKECEATSPAELARQTHLYDALSCKPSDTSGGEAARAIYRAVRTALERETRPGGMLAKM
ncbi:hypothetical protein NFI08_16220 [Halomonas sp. EF61]|uniref:hypothetical protein n=1 Tax=Halomonas sp. EF61 TaxID=2950869 RepID=UPI0032DF58E9